MQKFVASSLSALLVLGTMPLPAFGAGPSSDPATATPIKHLVVIFQENISFDHYFGTYPYATNPSVRLKSTG
jgi:phospholipase C